MKKTIFILLALCMAFLLAACGAPATGASPAAPASSEAEATQPSESVAAIPSESAEPAASVELTIAAAASLTDVTAEISEEYAKVAPNVKLTFTYGASGALQTQIEQGAPADIFMSAATKQMDALDEQSLLLAGSKTNLLENKVVLIVPKDSDAGITSFEDVAGDKVEKIALGDPESVPAGQYAEQVFTSLNILDAVKEKANYGTDVRQVLTWVESGDVDCGVVYATDAATSDKVQVICEAPEGSAPKIIYPVAVIAATGHPDEAQSFIDYLKTPEVAALFEKYGFIMAE
jgi:molybdate transport system substrate-binding protein